MNAIHIGDSQLQKVGASGLVRMRDAETDAEKVIDLTSNAQASEAHSERLRQQMLESGVSLLDLDVGGDCVEALAGFFHERHRHVVDETGG